MANDPGTGGKPTGQDPATPAISFATKEEFEDAIKGHIGKALAPKLEKITKYEQELESLRSLPDQLADLQAQLDGKKQTADEKTAAEVQKLSKQLEALQSQVETERGNTAQVQQAWHQSVAASYLQGLAIEAGAAPTAVPDLPSLFPRDQIAVEVGTDGTPVPRLIDPGMAGMPHKDQLAAMRAFLATKPHLRASPPNGAGQAGGGPGQPRSFEDLSPDEQLKEALGEQGLL